MARTESIFRWGILACWTVFVAAPLIAIWRGYLERSEVADHPWAWGVYGGLLFLTGWVGGAWADWLLRKLDRSRENSRTSLGVQLCSLSLKIVDRLDYSGYDPNKRGHVEWSRAVHAFDAALTSAFINIRKLGIWTPGSELYRRQDGGVILVDYLRRVGTMLKDGHFAEAKREASNIRDAVLQKQIYRERPLGELKKRA